VRCHNELLKKRHWIVAVAAGSVFFVVTGAYLFFG